jgi:hypothetical protein
MITIFTIVLDGMPYITEHLPVYQSLTVPWRWLIAEGASENVNCTKWCKWQEPRHSWDGTEEYLASIDDPRVTYLSRKLWAGKKAMINNLLLQVTEPCVLVEADADELHSKENLELLYEVFNRDASVGCIQMPCRYFVGPDLVCIGTNCWSNRDTEWERAWRYLPGDRFSSHEPPVFPYHGRVMRRAEAQHIGLKFDHYAYATYEQAIYKEKFYGYTGLVDQWIALQKHQEFPVQLDKFFPFAKPSPMVIRI